MERPRRAARPPRRRRDRAGRARTQAPDGRRGPRAAIAARDAEPADREACENDLSRAISTVSDEVFGHGGKAERLAGEVRGAGTRVLLARQFYNDAVRDDLALRRRWLPRLLTVRHRGETRHTYFEIADSADALDVAMTREEPTRART
jgi:hypothetical protein